MCTWKTWMTTAGVCALAATVQWYTPVMAANAAQQSPGQYSGMPAGTGMMHDGDAMPGGMMRGGDAMPGGMMRGGMPMPSEVTKMGSYGGSLHMNMAQAGMVERMLLNDSFNDKAFLSAMIAHHEGAVDMARDALKKAKDAQVRDWADTVISNQMDEIKDMSDMLNTRGGEDAQASRYMKQQMQHMMSRGEDPDLAYVQGMIGHHASAIYMAVDALIASRDADVKALAEDIIDAQLDEIKDMREWLTARQNKAE